MISEFKSLNNVIKLQNHVHQAAHMQLNVSCPVIAWNVSLHRRQFTLSDTRRPVFAQLIIFACLAFRAAQRGLGSYTSIEKRSVHMRTNNSWRQFDRFSPS